MGSRPSEEEASILYIPLGTSVALHTTMALVSFLITRACVQPRRPCQWSSGHRLGDTYGTGGGHPTSSEGLWRAMYHVLGIMRTS